VSEDLDDLLALASEVATVAGETVARTAQANRAPIDTKASRTDFVTATDREAEAYISKRLLAVRPRDSFLGEEGVSIAGSSHVRWVVDPIDGTVNFAYGMPGYCTSIAAEVDRVVAVGVVFDPLRSELFAARLEGGAYLNGVRIERSTTMTPLADVVVGTGFSYESSKRRRQALELVGILPYIGDIRRIGSAALEMCWVACNRLDAYFESGTKHWDRAAGLLVASEAGAKVLEAPSITSDSESIVLAAPHHLASDLLKLIMHAQQQATETT
jgi:myo-inositol-1(or 4)-monophosphatase